MRTGISRQYILDSVTEVIYTATEKGKIIMMSIVNADIKDVTINVRKQGKVHSVRIIARNTLLKVDPDDAAYISEVLLDEGQSIIVETDGLVEIDLNIE